MHKKTNTMMHAIENSYEPVYGIVYYEEYTDNAFGINIDADDIDEIYYDDDEDEVDIVGDCTPLMQFPGADEFQEH